jgi:STE24 endopeptidase
MAVLGIDAGLALAALLLVTETFFTALAALNVRHAARTLDREREWVVDELDADPERLLAYLRAKTALGRARGLAVVGAVLAAVLSGTLAGAVATLDGLGLPPLAEGVVFFLGVVAAGVLLDLPFDAVSTFLVEERFGFNNRSPALFLRDELLGLAVSLAVTGVLATVVLVIVGLPAWPVLATAAFVAFALVMQVVYPRAIAPLFNEFDPVEGDDRTAVEAVFERAGFETDGIYEMDASRRSSKLNAYFVGFGRSKRVVLFDTLLEEADSGEMQSVLAHELAHWKRNHVWKRLGAGALRMGVLFGALAWLLGTDLASVGGVADAGYARLAVGALWLWPVSRLTAPLDNRLSLAHVMGSGEPMASALARLGTENLANPFPHPLYAAFHYDHPPIPERIRRLRERTPPGADAGDDDPSGVAGT